MPGRKRTTKKSTQRRKTSYKKPNKSKIMKDAQKMIKSGVSKSTALKKAWKPYK